MQTVSIRNLRGKGLRENARKGMPMAITNHRVLIGVVIPVAAAWVEHVIDYNWSYVRQSISEAEQAIAAGKPMVRIDDLVGGPDAPGGEGRTVGPSGNARAEVAGSEPEWLNFPLVAALFAGTLTQSPESGETLERLRMIWNPPGSAGAQGNRRAEPAVRTVRIGDLSAGLIQRAGAAGQTLAITHDRELVGIVIPVTQGLVEFLIEQNVSRVLYNISLSEKHLTTADRLTPLDQVIEAAGRSDQPRPAESRLRGQDIDHVKTPGGH